MRGPTAQRSSAAPGQVEVELVEDDAALLPGPVRPRVRSGGEAMSVGGEGRSDARTGRAAHPAHRAPTTPGARRALVGAVLAALAVVAVASVSETRREAQERAAVAALPGVLETVEGPLVTAWSVPGSTLSGLTAHLVLVGTPAGTSALDPATGRVVWEWPVEPSSTSEGCSPLRTPDPTEVVAAVHGGPVLEGPAGDVPGALVACVRELAAVRDHGRTVTQHARITILAADDGHRLHGWTTRGRVVLVAHLGGGDDVVAAVRSPDGHLEAMRWDARTGAERWRTVTEREVSGPVHGVWAASAHDGVLVVDQPGPLRLDVETGAVLGPVVRGGVAGIGLGAERDTADRVAAPPPVHDDSLPLIGLRPGSRLTAVDLGSGEELWSRSPGTPLAQLDGLVVVREEARTVAVRATDGELVWSVPTARHVRFGPMVDARVLLLPTGGRSALQALPGARARPALDLVAVDPRDGLERWRSALPTGTFALTATPDGYVVVQTTGGVVGLGTVDRREAADQGPDPGD